uniref:SCHIP-1 domain-containing protein n=1 Tax=Angiostrongylus cantonensis TaxID=6313 RepID=A0A0K0D3A3_ANGCA
LIERDSLHMEHDSLLVDIDDFTEHEAECSALDFPYLLGMIDGRIPSTSPFTGPVMTYGTGVEHADSCNGTSHLPVPVPTPTSPTKALVAHLPKSLTRLVLFRR